jgi:hypothetical protein
MEDNMNKIQNEISQKTESVYNDLKSKFNPRRWAKYNGDVITRIFSDYILKEINPDFKISQPNAYIDGFPTEFDLLIVDKNANPIRNTNSYNTNDLHFGLEIKSKGIIAGRKDLDRVIKRIKNNFDEVKKEYQDIEFIYITYSEVWKPKRKNSIDYLEETICYLKPYPVFCLKNNSTNNLIEGQWEALINYINNIKI